MGHIGKKLKGKRLKQSLVDIYLQKYRLDLRTFIPTVLYRSFDEREHAEQFCNGSLRFGSLDYYKNSEDPDRADPTEGSGRAKVAGESLIVDFENKALISTPGIENMVVRASERDHYIYCFTFLNGACECKLPSHFGQYCVKVNNPRQLFIDVSLAMLKDKTLKRNPPSLDGGLVSYNKGENLEKPKKKEEILKMAWIQKPEKFSDESEFRMHFHFTSIPQWGMGEFHFINVGKKLKYCEIIEVKT